MQCVGYLRGVRLFGRRWRRHYALSRFTPIAGFVNLWHVIEDLWDAVEVGPHPLAIALAVARSLPSGHLW